MSLSEFMDAQPWAIKTEALHSIWNAFDNAKRANAYTANAEALTPNGKSTGDYSVEKGVAVIAINGAIMRTAGSTWGVSWSGQAEVKNSIECALQDKSVNALLLSIDSPGGIVSGTKELADYISGNHAKPIYAYVNGCCASAAFWLASATNRIFAPLTASVGNIGVIYVHTEYSKLYEDIGIKRTCISAGAWKSVGSPDFPLPEEHRASIQKMMNDLHDIFKDGVSTRLNLDRNNATAWGDGQIFLAREAHSLGLVHQIVADRDGAIDQINKEIFMDRNELAQKHPELLAQIEAAARQGWCQSSAVDEAVAKTRDSYNALVSMVAGTEVAAKVAGLAASGLTPEQVQALTPLLSEAKAAGAASPAPPANQEADSRQAILNALHAATPAPLASAPLASASDMVQTAIDRISAIGRS